MAAEEGAAAATWRACSPWTTLAPSPRSSSPWAAPRTSPWASRPSTARWCPAAARAAALSRTAARPRREVVRAVDGLPTESASRAVLEVDDPEPPRRGRAETDGDAGVGRNDANPSSANDAAVRVVDERRRTRRYRVDGVASSGGVPDTMWRDVADWLHRGFDAVVVAHGQSGSGKTRALFGTAAARANVTAGFGVATSSARSRATRQERRHSTGLTARHPNTKAQTLCGSPSPRGSCFRTATRWTCSTLRLRKGVRGSGSGSTAAPRPLGRAIASRACVASRFATRRRARRR